MRTIYIFMRRKKKGEWREQMVLLLQTVLLPVRYPLYLLRERAEFFRSPREIVRRGARFRARREPPIPENHRLDFHRETDGDAVEYGGRHAILCEDASFVCDEEG